MKTADVLVHYKTQAAIAKALTLKGSSIARWFKKGAIPHLRQLQLEALTKGALKADKGILPRRTTKSMSVSAQNKVIV